MSLGMPLPVWTGVTQTSVRLYWENKFAFFVPKGIYVVNRAFNQSPLDVTL
jgi:hypothetical protein